MQFNIRSVCNIRYVLLSYFNLPIFMENVNMRLVHFSRRYWWHRFSLINDSKAHKSFYRDNLTCSWKKIRLKKGRITLFISNKLFEHFSALRLCHWDSFDIQKTVIISSWRCKQGKSTRNIDSFEFYVSSSKTLIK